MNLRCLFLLGATLSVLAPGNADACDWAGRGYLTGWCGWAISPRDYSAEHIPYFAKHPPVYYSYPAPRPYGYSPYAYPPIMTFREVVAVRPVLVRNGYVTGEPTLRKAEKSAPLRIINPFAQDAADPMPVPNASPLSDSDA